jgi:hypothetical protein
MLSFRNAFVGAVFVAAAAIAQAAVICTVERCSGPASEVVQQVFPTETGAIFLRMPPEAAANWTHCSLGDGGYISLEPTHVRFKKIYATTLYALATGRQFQVRVSTKTTGGPCTVAYVTADS